MMKILLTNSSDIYGGGEYYVLELSRSLRDRGHEVLIACRPDNLLYTKCEQTNLPVIGLDFPPNGRLLHFINEIRGIIREKHTQIVHTNGNYDRTAGAFAAWSAGVPHVTNVHSLHSINRNLTHRIRNAMMTQYFLADGVQARDMLVNEDGIKESKVSVFYHGVNAGVLRRNAELRCKIRTEFHCADDIVLIGNVGRFVPMKGQEYLLRAFATAAKKFPDARLAMIGDGILTDDLKQLTTSLGIDKQVIFTGFRDDLVALYSAFDIYANSSVKGGGETISFATQQALAQELPVVVTDVGDVSQNVREGISGYVVPDRDPEAMADKLTRLVQDKSLRDSMGREGRKYLLERFTTERMAETVEKIYLGVLNGRTN